MQALLPLWRPPRASIPLQRRDAPRGGASHLLESPSFYRLLECTDVATFEVASDAFLSFRELLTRHPALTSTFLLAHSEPLFASYNSKLLASTNYVTRRQSLKARRQPPHTCAQQPPRCPPHS